MGATAKIVLAGGLIAGVAYLVAQQPSQPPQAALQLGPRVESPEEQAARDEAYRKAAALLPPDHSAGRRDAVRSLALKTFSWEKTGFGTGMHASFTISNPSDFDVRDVKISCDLTAPSGTRVDSTTQTIFEVFPARSTRTTKKLPMGFIHTQTAQATCGLIDAVGGDYRPPPQAKKKQP